MKKREDVTDLYWFWQKGKMTRKRKHLPDRKTIVYEQWLPNCEWKSLRFKNGFYNLLNLNMSKSEKYNGQCKAEFEKNYKRVNDIVTKSTGDVNKAISLSNTQANRITDEWKAINRAMAAKELGYAFKRNGLKNEQDICENIFEVFFQRAYELGSVTKQDYREYQLEKLGIC